MNDIRALAIKLGFYLIEKARIEIAESSPAKTVSCFTEGNLFISLTQQ